MTFQQAQFKYISYLRDIGVTGEIQYPDEDRSLFSEGDRPSWTLYDLNGLFLAVVYPGYLLVHGEKFLN